MEEQSAGPDVVAVVAIFADDPTDAVELSVIDRVTGKTVTRRLPADPAATRSAEVLSIRALELLARELPRDRARRQPRRAARRRRRRPRRRSR